MNYLPQTLADSELAEIFSTVGPLRNCKIVRDRKTNLSFGFGFVEYGNPQHASQAINRLNGLALKNKRIKVAYSRPSGEKSGNLYVKGFPKQWSEENLLSLFQQFGSIVQCRILREKSGSSKATAFVLYDKYSSAQQAIESLNNFQLDSSCESLCVKLAQDINEKREKNEMLNNYNRPTPSPLMRQLKANYRYNPFPAKTQPAPVPQPPPPCLFVYNIGPYYNETALIQLFSNYGNVLNSNVIREAGTGKSKGYGFVTMSDYQQAVQAIQALNGYTIYDKPLQVSFKTDKY